MFTCAIQLEIINGDHYYFKRIILVTLNTDVHCRVSSKLHLQYLCYRQQKSIKNIYLAPWLAHVLAIYVYTAKFYDIPVYEYNPLWSNQDPAK